MNSQHQHSPLYSWAWFFALLACAPGCVPWTQGESPVATASNAVSGPAASLPNGSAPPQAGPNLLADDQWVIALPGKGDNHAPVYRWRNVSLEQLSAQPAESQPRLEDFVRESGVRGANAAILLARAHNPQAAPALVKAVEDPTLKQPLRRAAAEALAALPEEVAVRNLHAAMTGIERKVGTTQPAYNADLHAELLMALARHRTADDEPAFSRALETDELPARLVALERWAVPGKTPVPPQTLELCQDADPRVRAVALRAIIARPCEQTEEQLQRATRDPVLDVKLTAIDGLGKLGTAGARKTLEQLFARDGEIVRAAAVNALVEMGASDVVATAAKDKSWRVRLAAAQNLSQTPPDEQAATARLLLTDPSGDVQRAVIAAVATWPLSAAGPLWLSALESSGYLGRKAAARQLAEYWPPAKAYSADAPNERRAARLAELRNKWRQEFGDANNAPAGNENSRPRDTEAALEEVATSTAPAAAVNRLRSNELEERRRGAKELALLAARQPLPPELFAELAPLVAKEQDATVWQSIFAVLSQDERPAAAELACAALSHPSADIRRRACEYLALHGRPEDAAAVAASLSDPQISVQIAAAKALGKIGSIKQSPDLEQFLFAGDKGVRVAAAESLLILHISQGRAALERLSYDSEEKIRCEVVEAMGRTRDEQFVPSLVRLLDDRASVKLAAVAALERIVGANAVRAPDDSATTETTDDVARRWKKWYHDRNEGWQSKMHQ